MNIDFDPTHFHPTFIGNNLGGEASENQWGNISMENFISQALEHSLTPEIISNAMMDAFDFFGIPSCPIIEGDFTAAHTGNPTTYADDIITIGRSELLDHGIHDQNSLSLIGTHEIVHLINQSLYASGELTQWQSELMADKWMGFRAAAQGLDLKNIFISFECLEDDPSHPGGDLRNSHIQQAYDTFMERMENGLPCDFQTLCNIAAVQIDADSNITIREHIANTCSDNDKPTYTQNMYSQSEIKSLIHEQENKIDNLKSLIDRNEREIDYKTKNGQPCSSNTYTIGSAKIDLDNARRRLNELKSMLK